MQQSKHSQPTPQTLKDNNTQKTLHHQCTHSEILDSTPTRNPRPTKTTGGQLKPLKHPVTNNTRPNNPATNQQTPKRRKEKNMAQRIRTECKRKARIAKPQGKYRQNATNHRQEILEVSLRRSEGTHKVEEESNLRKNAVGKKATMGTVCYL